MARGVLDGIAVLFISTQEFLALGDEAAVKNAMVMAHRVGWELGRRGAPLSYHAVCRSIYELLRLDRSPAESPAEGSAKGPAEGSAEGAAKGPGLPGSPGLPGAPSGPSGQHGLLGVAPSTSLFSPAVADRLRAIVNHPDEACPFDRVHPPGATGPSGSKVKLDLRYSALAEGYAEAYAFTHRLAPTYRIPSSAQRPPSLDLQGLR